MVPLFLKLLLSIPDGVQHLRSFKEVWNSGGPLPLEDAALLSSQDIKLHYFVASTEMGVMMGSGPARTSEWEWLKPSPLAERYLYFESFDPETGTCELVVRPGHPSLSVSNRSDGGWKTGDLFLPHPTQPGTWKYDRRSEEILLHSTGVKTDPLDSKLPLSCDCHSYQRVAPSRV